MKEWKTKVAKHTLENVKDFYEKEGYIFLDPQYLNSKTPHKVQCNQGHTTTMRLDNWMAGHRCKICSVSARKYSRKIPEKTLIKDITKWGYTFEGTLQGQEPGNRLCVRLQCPAGHIFEVLWSSWRRGDRCPMCTKYDKYAQRIKRCRNL
jgi:hypothetical protein